MTASIAIWLWGSILLTADPLLEAPVASAALDEADTIVLCAPGLAPELGPWLQHRAAQGHKIAVDTNVGSPERIRQTIRQTARSGKLQTVVLVGDVQRRRELAAFHLPTPLVKSEVIREWGPETHLAADNRYVDLDGDFAPDLAIGRLPAGSRQELRIMIRKILSYERAAPEGRWRRKINLVAGVGGFGIVADAVIETATRSFIRRGIPDGFETNIAYASWRSPYFPDPRRFRQHVVDQFNDGCLCWVYVGHGRQTELDWVRVPIGVAPILTAEDVDRIDCHAGSPIAVFLSCYGAVFDGERDGLTEKLVQHPGGPVAAMGGSRVTMPYGTAVLSQAMMDEMFRKRRETLGEVLLHAKRHTMLADIDRQHRLLNTVARTISPKPADLVSERREHVDSFHLLGDPLLRLHHPNDVNVKVDRSAAPGEEIRIKCRSNLKGRCLVELACRRGEFTFKPEARLKFDGTHDGMRELDQVFLRANDDVYARESVNAAGRPFEVAIKVPPHATGACTVRVYIEQPSADETIRPINNVDYAIGSASLYISEPDDATQLDDASQPDDAQAKAN